MSIAHKAVSAALSFTLMAVPVVGLSACSGGNSAGQDSGQATSQITSQASTVTVIGVQDVTALKSMLTNGLADDIQAISVRAKGADKWPESLLPNDALIASGAEVTLYAPADAKATAYEIRAVAGDRSYEFGEIPLADIASLALKVDGTAAYVDYQLTDGTSASTKDAVVAAQQAKEKEAVEARTNAEENEKAKQEAQAAEGQASPGEEAAQEQGGGEGYVEEYYEPSYSEPEYVEPAYEEPAPAPAQSEDVCVGGVVLK